MEGQDILSQMAQLVADQRFCELVAIEERPNLFRAVGQSNREVWHSAFVGWLLHPGSSHGLGRFPLQLFLSSLASSRVRRPAYLETDGEDLLCSLEQACILASSPILDSLLVQPREKGSDGPLGEKEAMVKGKKGFIDVWCAPPDKKGPEKDCNRQEDKDLFMAVEMKVDAGVSKKEAYQTKHYADFVRQEVVKAKQKGKNSWGLLVFLGPTEPKGRKSLEIARTEGYFCTDYQILHDKVLVPCLAHPGLNPDMRPLIEHYIRNLRTARKSNRRLAFTHHEQSLCRALFNEYRNVFAWIGEFLGEAPDDHEISEQGALRIAKKDRNRKVFALMADFAAYVRENYGAVQTERLGSVETIGEDFINFFGAKKQSGSKVAYSFNGTTLRYQNALPLAVVKEWAKRYHHKHGAHPSLEALQEEFPDSLAGQYAYDGFIVSLEIAKEREFKRLHLKETDLIRTSSGFAAVNNQWSKEKNLGNFCNVVRAKYPWANIQDLTDYGDGQDS
jgi:hypothetical protein